MDTEGALKLPRAAELPEFICYWPDEDDDDADDYDDDGEDGAVSSRREHLPLRAGAEALPWWLGEGEG